MRLNNLKIIVHGILEKDELARSNDHYLYTKVVEKMNPFLLNAPFIVAFNDSNMPKFESVRRCRQKVQEDNPLLRPDADTECGRMLKEEEYKEFAIHG